MKKQRTTSWNRNCPMCKKHVTYTTKCMYEIAQQKNSVCRSCNATRVSKLCHLGRKLSTAHRKKCAMKLTGDNNPMFGKSHSEKSRVKMSRQMLSSPNPTLARMCPSCTTPVYYRSKKCLQKAILRNTLCRQCGHNTPGYKKALRCRTMKALKRRGVIVNFNETACGYFDKISERRGWKLRHALNGGEVEMLGYSLDAYDAIANVVVEYDERRHYDVHGNLRPKDLSRMLDIITHIGCDFYRYNEAKKELAQYKLNQSGKMWKAKTINFN